MIQDNFSFYYKQIFKGYYARQSERDVDLLRELYVRLKSQGLQAAAECVCPFVYQLLNR